MRVNTFASGSNRPKARRAAMSSASTAAAHQGRGRGGSNGTELRLKPLSAQQHQSKARLDPALSSAALCQLWPVASTARGLLSPSDRGGLGGGPRAPARHSMHTCRWQAAALQHVRKNCVMHVARRGPPNGAGCRPIAAVSISRPALLPAPPTATGLGREEPLRAASA